MVKGKPHLFMFDVEQYKGERAEDLDFGYLARTDGDGKKGEVYYNIYNVFKVDEINCKTQKGVISYGALAYLRYRRDNFTAQLENKPKP